jgi:hypothetical protein
MKKRKRFERFSAWYTALLAILCFIKLFFKEIESVLKPF